MGEHIRRHVRGAPIQVGAAVVVGVSLDETFDVSFVGREGIVVYLDYGGGCGQTFPGDPMIGVRFPEGVEELFWREELVLTTDAPHSIVSQVYQQFRPIIDERIPAL